jgi:hypothetical protein
MIDRLIRETSSSSSSPSSSSSHAIKTITPNAYEKKHGIVERCTHSVDALRAATPSRVETLPSKTSLGRRRVVVVEDEDAVETREAAARRNMCAHRIGSVRFGSREIETESSSPASRRLLKLRVQTLKRSSLCLWLTPRSKV